MSNDYDFPVQLQPVFLAEGQLINNRKAVVRTDTMNTLGIVSDDYGLVKHGNVIDTFREACRDIPFEENVTMTHDGAHLFYEMLFPKTETEIKKDDIVRMRMVIKNSYNGMNSLQIVFGALRLVCLNGMVIGTKFYGFSYRHTKNIGRFDMDDSLDTLEVKKSLERYMSYFATAMHYIQPMTEKRLHLVDKLFDKSQVYFPNYLLEEAKESYKRERDKTVWGYYNALTYAVTHKMKKESPALAIQYGAEAWKAAERAMS